MSSISQAIQKDRLEQNISQGLLARMVGVSQQVLSRWESGQSLPRGLRVDELIRVLGPNSHTAQIIKQLREIEPRSLESLTQVVPNNRNELLAQALRRDESESSKLEREAAKRLALAEALRTFGEKEFTRRPPLSMAFTTAQDLQMQFAKASDQLIRVTSLMGRVAVQMTEATEILARLQPAIEQLREEERAREKPSSEPD